jgi:hypothetical protein
MAAEAEGVVEDGLDIAASAIGGDRRDRRSLNGGTFTFPALEHRGWRRLS